MGFFRAVLIALISPPGFCFLLKILLGAYSHLSGTLCKSGLYSIMSFLSYLFGSRTTHLSVEFSVELKSARIINIA